MTQTAQRQTAETLKMRRHLKAAPERVFDAFTRPQELAAWFGPGAVTIRNLEADVRPGGAYRLEMHYDDGSFYALSGQYLEVDRPARLAMTWVWGNGDYAGQETLVTISFSPAPDGTMLELTHENLAGIEARDQHEGGWLGSFDCLERHLAG
jgi:uncharacterized protein YndB with AHSA1/START domain